MMKRFLCMALALTALLSLAACGRTMRKAEEIVESVMPTMTTAPTEAPEAFSSAAPETPDGHDAAAATDVLSAIREADADGESALMNYPAAAKVLTFCADGGTERDTFERDVKAYFKTMDDAQREEFRARFDAVITLAQNIAKGDVEQSDLEQADDLKDFDPVTFQHENLEAFEKTVRAALA